MCKSTLIPFVDKIIGLVTARPQRWSLWDNALTSVLTSTGKKTWCSLPTYFIWHLVFYLNQATDAPVMTSWKKWPLISPVLSYSTVIIMFLQIIVNEVNWVNALQSRFLSYFSFLHPQKLKLNSKMLENQAWLMRVGVALLEEGRKNRLKKYIP